MILRISIFLILFSSSYSFAQKDYALTIMDSLCSERYDGRGYVNNGDVRAADFIVRELKDIGLVPLEGREFEQHYTLNVNTFPGRMLVVIDQDTLKPGGNYLVNSMSGSAKGSWRIKEINPANVEEILSQPNAIKTINENGAIPVFNFVDLKDKELLSKLKDYALQSMQISPVVWIEKNKQMFSVGRAEAKFPMITINAEDFKGGSSIELDIENNYVKKHKTKNIIAYIPGKRKRKQIVFSAHYDHLGRMGSDAYFPGANDNASGVAMLLSLAKYYAENPPKYSIVFCFFSGEEAGLVGSRYFVNNPWLKLKRIKFVLNVDIMGGASKGITLVNGTVHKRAFNRFVKINEEKQYLPLIKKRGPTANSDHFFFSQMGVPAFFVYSMGTVSNYHDIYDTAANTPLNRFNEVQNLLIDFVGN